MRFCIYCGAKHNDDDLFCPECGKRIFDIDAFVKENTPDIVEEESVKDEAVQEVEEFVE